MQWLLVAVVGVVAFGTASIAVPLITRYALSKRLLDVPDGVRRTHDTAIPRLGGVAVFAGLLLAIGLAFVGGKLFGIGPSIIAPHSVSLLAAAAMLFGIGLLDDLIGVLPVFKILGQSVASWIVCANGFVIHQIGVPPSYTISLGVAAVPVTIVWLVGVSNAFNLVDGLDGLAGGVGLIALATSAAAAAVLGNETVPLYCVALGGALLGFLRYNWAPARIFLGDSGSLVVGFLLAYLAVKGGTQHDGTLLAIVPVFALSYPLLDTGIAMLRRWLRDHPLSRADGRHIHHQLRALGFTPRRSALMIFVEAGGVAILGLCVTFTTPSATIAVASAGGAILLFIFVYGVRWLQYHEFIEAGAVVASAGSRMRGAIRDTIAARDFVELIEIARTLEEINVLLRDAARMFRFAHMRVGAATPDTVFDAVNPATRTWKLEYPIITPSGEPVTDGDGRPMVLSFWCALHNSMTLRTRRTSVERVAVILAPAIASWSETSPDPLTQRARNRRVYLPVRDHMDTPSTSGRALGSVNAD
jgi:UDP-GlcNAc:undecaprenyl-phosphate GlcNAc-1-phosphate transferase